MALCGVCSVEALKYKCASCKAPSCSLPCYKTHAAQCTAGPPQLNHESADTTAGVADDTRDSSNAPPHHPSAAELGELFMRYPTLRAQLQDIYKATQRPEERSEENNSFRGRFNGRGRGRGSFAPKHGASDARQWTPDKGFDRGLKQLQRGLEQETNSGEALRILAGVISKTTTIEQPENDVHKMDQ